MATDKPLPIVEEGKGARGIASPEDPGDAAIFVKQRKGEVREREGQAASGDAGRGERPSGSARATPKGLEISHQDVAASVVQLYKLDAGVVDPLSHGIHADDPRPQLDKVFLQP